MALIEKSNLEIARAILTEIEEHSELLFDGVQNIVVMTETDLERIKNKFCK